MRVNLVNSDRLSLFSYQSWNEREASCADAIRLVRFRALREIWGAFSLCGIGEMEAALDLGSSVFGRAGSSPASRTKVIEYGELAEWSKAPHC